MWRSLTVTSPDGDQWQVRRRWLDRPVPRLQSSLREANDDVGLETGLQLFSVPDLTDSIPLAIGIAIAVALLVFLLLPLIGVALEIAVLIALLSSGIARRVLLRRPWTIEARNLDQPELSAAFAVKGWRQSRRAIDELATAIPVSGLPQQIAGAGRSPSPSYAELRARR